MIRTIEYLPHDVNTGPRVGGTCPSGLESELAAQGAQYFGTFPNLDNAAMEFSVFHRFDMHGIDTSRDLIDHNNKLIQHSKNIWAVVHSTSVRSSSSARSFQGRGLLLSELRADTHFNESGEATPWPESKLGGACFLERHWLYEDIQDIEALATCQLLQIGLHGKDKYEGFPWDPGYLHIWATDPLDADSYAFLIEQ